MPVSAHLHVVEQCADSALLLIHVLSNLPDHRLQQDDGFPGRRLKLFYRLGVRGHITRGHWTPPHTHTPTQQTKLHHVPPHELSIGILYSNME